VISTGSIAGVPDKNRLYVQYWFPPGTEVPARLREVATEEFVRPRGSVLSFESWESSSTGWKERQEEFDRVLESVYERIERAGVTSETLSALGGQLEVRVVHLPSEGIAGLVIRSETMKAWSQLGADWYVEAWVDDAKPGDLDASAMRGPAAEP
jgi:hypothetical protein